MICKAFEIRDAATFIPVLAIRMLPDNEAERYLLRRSGYGLEEPLIMLVRMDANGTAHQASYDPYGWGMSRTLGSAQEFIAANWESLSSGMVIDVEFILGETTQPKMSERLEACP